MGAARDVIDDGDLGEYRIVRPLGHGGMGLVFLGHDTVLDRPVAIKLIATPAPTVAARERFLIEARAIARLAHPNVVAVYRAGETRDGRPFLVQELVRGQSLDRLATPLAAAEVRRIGVGMARGLAAAHRRGVLHRDLKPANVMLADDGTIKLLDFGLAKLRPLDDAPLPPPRLGPIEPLRLTGSTVDGGGPIVAITAGRAITEAPLAAAGAPDPSLTRPGVLMGTPRYLAPEQWRGEVATERSDLYALAAVLFELATGRPVHRGDQLDELRASATTVDAPPLASLVPDVDAALATIVDRALARDPAARPASADAMAQALATADDRAAAPRVDNPYRGLAAFAADDRGVFFGRGAEVGAIVDRLRSEQAVVIAGDSGVGKSSLCRAGVLPAIAAGGLGGDRRWTTIAVRPGAHPRAAVLDALGASDDELAAALATATAAPRGLVVLIDQAEELITLAGRAEATQLADELTAAFARDPGLRVVAAVRGDFVTRLAEIPGVAAWVTRGLHLIGPLDEAGRREAIVGPAQVAGVAIDPAAVEALVAGSGGRGGLPLLQSALALVWQRRDVAAAQITLADLEAIGGVAGALARHADGVLAALDPSGRGGARRLLTALVTADGTSAVREASELTLDAPVLDALVAGRLIVARDGAGGAAYALAHDALIDHWATLAGWLVDDRSQRPRRDRLAAAAAEWIRLGRGRDGLLTRRQLVEVAELDQLGPREAALIATSRRALRRTRALQLGLIAIAASTIVAVWSGTRWAARRARDRAVAAHVTRHDAIALDARRQAAALDGKRARAFARFDADDDPGGEVEWASVAADTATLRATYRDAAAALESALLLAATARRRVQMAELLYAHALVAEQAYDRTAIDELLPRVAAHAPAVAQRWTAPGHLTIVVDPPAAVAVRCLVGDPSQRQLGPVVARVDGARHTIELPPGSCVIAATAPDRVDVHAPIVIGRAEAVTVELSLPPRRAAPPGFVYVPRGRFRFGAADPDDVRINALGAQPEHDLVLPGFWIARHETTLGEWLDYLAALPADQRAARRPRTDTNYVGALELIEDRDGTPVFVLRRGDTITYRVRRGEPFRYLGRTARAEQQWERFPVAGITTADAIAYATWLDRTGRVPGARLCTEREWERAARGADGRRYPHADVLDPATANIDLTYGRVATAFGPDEVGSHPASDSPFGVADLAGNVWELLDGDVIRGGSWYQGSPSARATNHWNIEPSFRDPVTGVRLCATAPN